MNAMFRSFVAAAVAMSATIPAMAADPTLFPLSEEQAKAFEAYGKEKGEKAFAAGPAGQFSAQTGYLSATIAASEALKACDKDVSEAAKRCVLIDLNGTAVPYALQLAQASRADAAALDQPLGLRDFALNEDVQKAVDGYAEKAEQKAFAVSVKGPWARSWEAKTIEDAEKYALETCNKSKRAAGAPCFILFRNGERVDPTGLAVNADLSVAKQP